MYLQPATQINTNIHAQALLQTAAMASILFPSLADQDEDMLMIGEKMFIYTYMYKTYYLCGSLL